MAFSRDTFRTLLVLGRVSNVPTVWSNCLAGWLLSAGESWGRFFLLCLGATLVYIAGMYLNDAFDSEFDARHRAGRPVPSGKISLRQVWIIGWTLLCVGGLILFSLGKLTALLAFLLMVSVIVYDAVHKKISFSPVIMASCRLWLYLVAGSVAEGGIAGATIWSGIALACYIVGLSYLARRESLPGALRFWPAYLLAAPILLALFMNGGRYVGISWLGIGILLSWILWSLRATYWSHPTRIGQSVAYLLAGIALVDGLAVLGGMFFVALFAGLFLLSLLFQRSIPAT